MSDETRIQFPVPELPRDATMERLLTEVYRLQGEVNKLASKVASVEGRQNDHLELGSTVEGHGVKLNEHEEQIDGLVRSVDSIKGSAASMERTLGRMRESAALVTKQQTREYREILDKLSMLVELHQPKVAL